MELFLIDEDAIKDFRRRCFNKQLTQEEFANLAAEFCPKMQREEPMILSDNFVRDHAHLSSKETKLYIPNLVSRGVLHRNDVGELEITDVGKALHIKLRDFLNSEMGRQLREFDDFLAQG